MTIEPDVPDDDEARVPAQDPGAAVDDLQSSVAPGPDGDTPDPAEDDDPPSPAFDIDLDPEDQGTAEAAAANPD
jgi:hypothetical protein